MPVSRLTLTEFRSYASVTLEPDPGFVLLFGENGAGKTNLLEAVSMLAPGRGLRGAPLSEMTRQGASGWAVAARKMGTDIGTGTIASSPERRQVRINGVTTSVNNLSERLSILWLTPAMDRIFSGSGSERRRFLDRLVLALEPTHAHHASRYERAMRARNKLLADGSADDRWLVSLELAMAEHGAHMANARERTVSALGARLDAVVDDAFASAEIAIDGWSPADIAESLRANRRSDAAARRATWGPHRQDLLVVHRAKQMQAAQCSTGEQKALLLGLILAHAELVAERRSEPPILLLDEVAAHLDPRRRTALFQRLSGRGQVWMTATEAALFEGIDQATRIHVTPGSALRV